MLLLSLFIVANVLLSEVLVHAILFGLYCKWFGCGGGGLGYPIYGYGYGRSYPFYSYGYGYGINTIHTTPYYGGSYGVYTWREWRRRWGYGGYVQQWGYGGGGGHRRHLIHRHNIHRSHGHRSHGHRSHGHRSLIHRSHRGK